MSDRLCKCGEVMVNTIDGDECEFCGEIVYADAENGDGK